MISAHVNTVNENERESMGGGGEPVVSEHSRTQRAVEAWLRCCREAAWTRRRWEGGLLTHLGVDGRVRRGGLLTSGQPCKSRKPRRWPWSKVCLVNRGDFWQKMK